MIVDVKEVSKQFKAVKALSGVSFSVEEGEVFGLLGPNGAGKTTTVKILTTLLKPSSGSASVCGHDVLREPSRVRESIGYVCQELTSDTYLTGRENLMLQGNLYHIPRQELRQKAGELLGLVGLNDAADRYVEHYSGGMRKRLDIACGLLHDPRLLFLDEPTLGLDPTTRLKVWEHIREINKGGTTIILCTNYLEEADRICERVGIMDSGELKVIGRPDDLKKELGGDVVSLNINGTHDIAFLRGLPFVKGILEADGAIKILVHSNEEAIPKIFRELLSRNVHVEKISYSRPTLDEVFIKYTGRKLE